MRQQNEPVGMIGRFVALVWLVTIWLVAFGPSGAWAQKTITEQDSSGRKETKFDAKGNITDVQQSGPNGELISSEHREYGPDGKLSVSELTTCDQSGRRVTKRWFDSEGREVKRIDEVHPTGSAGGPTPGAPAGPTPGPSPLAPGAMPPAGPTPGSPAGTIPGTPAGPTPGPAPLAPNAAAPAGPPAGPTPGNPAGNIPGAPAGPTPGLSPFAPGVTTPAGPAPGPAPGAAPPAYGATPQCPYHVDGTVRGNEIRLRLKPATNMNNFTLGPVYLQNAQGGTLAPKHSPDSLVSEKKLLHDLGNTFGFSHGADVASRAIDTRGPEVRFDLPHEGGAVGDWTLVINLTNTATGEQTLSRYALNEAAGGIVQGTPMAGNQ